MQIHFSANNRTIYVDRGAQITTIPLPSELDPVEVAYLIKSDTMRAVLMQLTERGD